MTFSSLEGSMQLGGYINLKWISLLLSLMPTYQPFSITYYQLSGNIAGSNWVTITYRRQHRRQPFATYLMYIDSF